MIRLIIGVVALAAIFVYPVAYYNSKAEYTFTVDSKERQCDSSGSGENASIDCYYVVYGTDGEVFSNKDTILFFKWDSASVQAKLKEDNKYTVTAAGWRVPFLSMKPNIISIHETTY